MRIKVILQSIYHKLFNIYTYYSYCITYPLCIFKRPYSSNTCCPEVRKFSKQYKQEYELTQEQIDAIIGIILADGSLERGKPSHNTRLKIDHSYPEQESYVLGLRILFASLIASEPVIIVRKADTRTGKVYKSISVRTLRFPCLNKYHDLFYKDKKKNCAFKYTRFIDSYRVSSITNGRWLLSQRCCFNM